jgi:hypothetical protein
MTVYSTADMGEDRDALLEEARQEGQTLIKREDGRIFVVRPEPQDLSPLDVSGVDLGLSRSDIVRFIRHPHL